MLKDRTENGEGVFFTHKFQAKIPAELTVVEKIKMAAMCTMCIIR